MWRWRLDWSEVHLHLPGPGGASFLDSLLLLLCNESFEGGRFLPHWLLVRHLQILNRHYFLFTNCQPVWFRAMLLSDDFIGRVHALLGYFAVIAIFGCLGFFKLLLIFDSSNVQFTVVILRICLSRIIRRNLNLQRSSIWIFDLA